jgi:hypothetical protein
MKAIRPVLAAALVVGLGLSAPAAAQEGAAPSHLYVGANGGQAHWRMCPTAATCDDLNGTLSVFAGYRINPIFSAEVAFRNYGEAKTSNATIKGKGWEVVGVAEWPVVGDLSVYGKLGLFQATIKGDGALLGNKETTVGPTYGLGLQLDVSKAVALRAEWQAYPNVGGTTLPKGDIDALTVGVLWRFR